MRKASRGSSIIWMANYMPHLSLSLSLSHIRTRTRTHFLFLTNTHVQSLSDTNVQSYFHLFGSATLTPAHAYTFFHVSLSLTHLFLSWAHLSFSFTHKHTYSFFFPLCYTHSLFVSHTPSYLTHTQTVSVQWRPWVDFINILRAAFKHKDPKSVKIQSSWP